MLRKVGGLLLEMEWVPWCWISFFIKNKHRWQHLVQPCEAWMAVKFRRAGLVNYPLERIPGGPGDKWAVVRMVGAWYW